MQGWYWDYPKTPDGNTWADTMSAKAVELGDAGITHLWLPPLSRASFGSGSNGYDPKYLFDLGEYGDGTTSYRIRSNVTLIGEFQSGGNPLFGDQNVNLYPTILSGDIGTADDVADNIYNVVSATSSIDSASIEALIIEKGNANGGSIEHQKGGGLYNSEFLILKDVTLRNNIGQTTGNGVFNNSNLGKITMDNVKLLNNTGSSSDVQNENGATIKVKTNSEVNE